MSERTKKQRRHIRRCIKRINPENVRPLLSDCFRMFKILPPYKVRVVIIGQDPYTTSCNTFVKQFQKSMYVYYAYGIGFYINRNVGDECPITATAKNIILELRRTQKLPREISLISEFNSLLRLWISQGVFLTNVALTAYSDNLADLGDHSVMWESFTRKFVEYLNNVTDCIFVLMGKKAWEIGSSISSVSRIIKVPHPVSRDGSFVGCDMFQKIDSLSMQRGYKIEWI